MCGKCSERLGFSSFQRNHIQRVSILFVIVISLKPENIMMVDMFSEIKLFDFDLSSIIAQPSPKSSRVDLPDRVGGTLEYMAPELFLSD